MLTDFCGNLLFLSVAGGAIQWSVSIREPPCGSGVVPLHERTSSLQLPVRTWGCRIQTIPFSGDWEHPCHWSQTPFWNSGRIQCKGELSLNLKMFYITFIRYIGYNADKWRWHIPVLYYVFGIEYGANCKIHTFMWFNEVLFKMALNTMQVVQRSNFWDVECVFLPGRWMMMTLWG